MSSNAVVSMLRGQFQMAHEWMTGTMQGLDEEQLHWLPEGRAGSIAAEYAHSIIGEDVIICMALGATPLLMSAYANQTGADSLPPIGTWGDWGRSVRVDMAQLTDYAKAVYAATDAHLATLADDDLAREVDVTQGGLGKMPLGVLLSVMFAHISMHMGEISNMKGQLGLQGYPF